MKKKLRSMYCMHYYTLIFCVLTLLLHHWLWIFPLPPLSLVLEVAVTNSRRYSLWSRPSSLQSVSRALSHWHNCVSLASLVNQKPQADGQAYMEESSPIDPVLHRPPCGKQRRMETHNADDAMVSTVCIRSHI